MSELESYQTALKVLLDSAEERNFDPPIPSIIVSELEAKIHELNVKEFNAKISGGKISEDYFKFDAF